MKEEKIKKDLKDSILKILNNNTNQGIVKQEIDVSHVWEKNGCFENSSYKIALIVNVINTIKTTLPSISIVKLSITPHGNKINLEYKPTYTLH